MWKSIKHQLEKIGIFVSGRTLGIALTIGLISLGAVSPNMGFLIALPIGAAVMGFLNHMDHYRDMELMTDRHREEIAARLGKNPALVTTKDLQTIADGTPEQTLPSNPILKQSVDRIHAIHMTSFLSAIAAVGLTIGTGLLLASAITTPLAMAGLMVTTAFITRSVIENRAGHWLRLDQETFNDRIIQLGEKRGKVKDYELFALAAEANPGLAKQIREAFGKPFARMEIEQKVEALERFGPVWNIPQITAEFNLGMIHETELPFALVGQTSGVAKQPPPPTLGEKAQALLGKGKELGHSAWMHLRVRNHKTGKEEDKLVICQPQTGCVTLDPEVSEKLLPLLKTNERHFGGQLPRGFVERYHQRQASASEPRRG